MSLYDDYKQKLDMLSGEIKQVNTSKAYSALKRSLPIIGSKEAMPGLDEQQYQALLGYQVVLEAELLEKEKQLASSNAKELLRLKEDVKDANVSAETLEGFASRYFNAITTFWTCSANRDQSLVQAFIEVSSKLKKRLLELPDIQTESALKLISFALMIECGLVDVADNKSFMQRLKEATGHQELNAMVGCFLKAELEFETFRDTKVAPYLSVTLNKLYFHIQSRLKKETEIDPKWTNLINYQKSSKPIPIGDRADKLTDIEQCIAIIEAKYQELEKRGEEDAKKQAFICWEGMNALSQAYRYGLITPEVFKKNAKSVIDTAHQTLDIHRGWKEVLINLAIAVLTLGVGYLALAIYQGSFFPVQPVKTDSDQKLRDLQDKVDLMPCRVM